MNSQLTTRHLTLEGGTLAYDLLGEGPLVVLAHGMGDSRHSYRAVAPALAAAGYRVATLDLRGCGDSTLGWNGYSRTDIAGDLLALVRHLAPEGPAVLVGQSISGGAATIAAAQAPDLVAGIVELAPFTRKQSFSLTGLLTVARYRRGLTRLAMAGMLGRVPSWMSYLDLAVATKPADWTAERGRIAAKVSEPGRMKVLQSMGNSSPTDAGEHLGRVRCPVLVVEGALDPDWADPRAEGEKILGDLPQGLGDLVVLDGVGHYPHVEAADRVVELTLPFLARTLGGGRA